jgi:ATP-dependent Clp protease adaptor protein ClpS
MADTPRHEEESGVAVETRKKVRRPQLYRVLIHNDDYTTQDFVVFVLKTIFHHSDEMAFQIMLHVHTRGIGVAGLFPYETAEAKSERVHTLARENEFPLKSSIEPE